jgi:hypothetical protein
MWACPKCGAEVEDDFEVCWGCGTSPEGVEDPSFDPETEGVMSAEDYEAEQEARQHEQLVTLATFWSPAEAHVVRLGVEAAGVRVYLADEQTIAMDWLLSNAIGGIKLQVAERDLERAREVLASLPAPRNDSDEEEGEED